MISKMRIKQEWEQIKYSPPAYCRLKKVQNDLCWILDVMCDSNAPFHSEAIKVRCEFKENYPTQKPLLTLMEPWKIWHPNITKEGYICHDDVKSTDPNIRVVDRINGLIKLLECPNPYNAFPQNKQITETYKASSNDWYAKARLKFKGYKI